MADAKPTILLVTGAFTEAKCYDLLLLHLEKAGYPYVVAALPSAKEPGSDNFDPSRHSAMSDGEYVMEEYLMPLLHEGKGRDVPIVKSVREQAGKKGGVLGLVYISFAFVPEGKTQLEVLGGEWPPFCKVDTPGPGLLTFDPVIDTLYNDTPASMHKELEAGHLPSAIKVFTSPVLSPLWIDKAFDGRRVLIKTLK